MRGFQRLSSQPGLHRDPLSRRSEPEGAEGGANLFRLEYFHKHAVLAQSPQFYKQMMVGVFDRVFEAAPVFRAEKHNTKRHLNEYTSLDFEMGYIDSFEDIMAMETGFCSTCMKTAGEQSMHKELKMLGVTLPKVDKIPAVRFDEAKRTGCPKNMTARSATHMTWSRKKSI
ncbi:MAG: amino acid--tRNA ligase-related protein [Eubacterium sp.]